MLKARRVFMISLLLSTSFSVNADPVNKTNNKQAKPLSFSEMIKATEEFTNSTNIRIQSQNQSGQSHTGAATNATNKGHQHGHGHVTEQPKSQDTVPASAKAPVAITKNPTNAPFHPECVRTLMTVSDPNKNMRTCTSKKSYYEAKNRSNWYKIDLPSVANKAYFEYKVFADYDNRKVIGYKIFNGKGAPQTGLAMVRDTASELKYVKLINEGYRCYGGLNIDKVENGKVYYTANVTPTKILLMGKQQIDKQQLKGMLATGAGDCYGRAHYVFDMNNRRTSLINVSLTLTGKNASRISSSGKLQGCFNKVYTTSAKKFNNRLNALQLSNFANEFVSSCSNNYANSSKNASGNSSATKSNSDITATIDLRDKAKTGTDGSRQTNRNDLSRNSRYGRQSDSGYDYDDQHHNNYYGNHHHGDYGHYYGDSDYNDGHDDHHTF